MKKSPQSWRTLRGWGGAFFEGMVLLKRRFCGRPKMNPDLVYRTKSYGDWACKTEFRHVCRDHKKICGKFQYNWPLHRFETLLRFSLYCYSCFPFIFLFSYLFHSISACFIIVFADHLLCSKYSKARVNSQGKSKRNWKMKFSSVNYLSQRGGLPFWESAFGMIPKYFSAAGFRFFTMPL